MTIDRNDPRWTAYVLGELDDQERAAFERELESSPEAGEILDDIRDTVGLLREGYASEEQVYLSAEQRQMVEIEAAPQVPAGRSRMTWAAGMAAAAVVLMGMVTIIAPSLLRSRQAAGPSLVALNTPVPGGPIERAPAPRLVVRNPNELATPPDTTAILVEPSPSQDAQSVPTEPAAGVAGQAESLAADRDSGIVVAQLQKQSTPPPPPPAAPGASPTQGIRTEELYQMRETYVAAVSNTGEPKAGPEGDLRARALPSQGVPVQGFAALGNEVDAISGMRHELRPDLPRRDRFNTEEYDRIVDNPFVPVSQDPLATFSIDVDTAAYANVRRFLNQRTLPPPDAVRIEEMLNYFTYDYAGPTGEHPVRVHTEVAAAPWNPQHRLVRFGIKGREIPRDERASSNLVFLIDVSGSMRDRNKLELLKDGMKLLAEQLTENDRVAIVVYAGASGMVLPSTTGDKKEVVIRALDRLSAGGSTNGGAGIELAYNTAVRNFIEGGTNRVVLATDGDFNVGVTNNGVLTRLIEEKAKTGVFLSVLGFGTGNYNDAGLESLADQGNGNYAYIDTIKEARKVLVQEMGSTLITIAKDVKIQIEFNPAAVNAYRLIGYENRVLEHQDFNDDTKDAGEIGSDHTVTALFEIVPAGVEINLPGVDPLKYQTPTSTTGNAGNGELLTMKIRYKAPDGDTSRLMEVAVVDRQTRLTDASDDYRFTTAVAGFGMLLRDSPHKGSVTFDDVIRIAEASKGADAEGYRAEFIELVRRARAISELN